MHDDDQVHRPRPKKNTPFVVIVVNIAILAIGLVVLELIFGKWFNPYIPPGHVPVDRTIKFRQRIYDPPSEVVYVRDIYALRGVKEPLRDVQIVTLGGSTTDQKYITEGETWQDVMRAHGAASRCQCRRRRHEFDGSSHFAER